MDKEKDVAALRRVRDRLHSTTNEQLGSVLDLLLPKLLPLANDTELQKDVLEVVNECLRRLKNGQQTISLVALFKLIRKELLPLACNLAITFIDVVLDGRVSTITNSVEAANELVESLIVFEPLSFQSNCLCYYAYRTLTMVITVLSNSATLLNSYSNSYSDSISEGNNDRNKSSNSVSAATELGSRVRQRASSILGDYLLDIALLRRAVVTSDAVGSVQPGLSGERVKRLTAKKTSWDLDTVKSVKLLLLDLLPRSTLPPFLSVAISIACLCDSDSVVSAQAVYKVQGAMNLFSVEEKPEETISGLLSLVMNECNSPTNESIKYVTTARTPLSADVLAGVLKWVGKYMQSHLFKSSKVLLGSLYKLLHNSDDSRFTVAVQTNALKVLLELCLHMDNSTIVVTSIIFLKCVKHMLMKAAASAGAVGTNNENRTSLRITCYNIIEQLAIRNADLMVKDIEVVVVLFRFVGSEDETCATRLHAALGALRLAHSASGKTNLILFTRNSS